MKFERLKHLENDWYIQVGGYPKAYEFTLRWFTGYGFRLTINFYSNRLVKLFGSQHIFGV